MQKHTITLLVGAFLLFAGGGMVASQWLAADDTPIVRWEAAEEQDVPAEPGAIATADDEATAAMERTAVAGNESAGAPDDRVPVVLRGRVVDKFRAPVSTATVWLDFARGGGPRGGGQANRQRRVPEPVTTDSDGRFAFQGETFRNLRVWLQVAHERHALGQFDKDIGPVATEVDLGELVLTSGGEVRGRVTDLDGNGIAAAAVRMQPENDNSLRLLRDRDKLLPAFTTDQNGFYRRPHLAAGDWSLVVTAKMHTEGRSGTFAVEEEQVVDVEDIRLGPGHEVTGYVRTSRGEPIAKAAVTMQSEGRARGGRRGPGGDNAGAGPGTFGGGREHRTTTDAQGRFFLEHLPGASMRLQVEADGYLDHRQDGVDPTLGQPLHVAMQDGLRIEGRVQEADGSAVSLFAVRATRLRGLPTGNAGPVDMESLMNQLRDGSLDEATRAQVRSQLETARQQLGGGRGRPGTDGEGWRGDRGERGGPGDARGGPRSLGKPEPHANGRFVLTGLQEGVYEVHVQSPDHARQRSQPIELRRGAEVQPLVIQVDGGLFVAGLVLDTAGDPIRGATVELRTPSPFEGRRGRNGGARSADGVDFESMSREFMRMTSGTQLTLEATTDADGGFVLKHVPPGTYRLHAEAKRHAAAASEPFELLADRSGMELRLGALGSIAGVVRGLAAGEAAEARIAAVPVLAGGGGGGGGGGAAAMFGRRGGAGSLFQNVRVASDGSYRIDDLTPGDYIVRAWIGSPQELMRELGAQFLANTIPADAAVRGGETTQLDVAIVRPRIGTVGGTVLHNGAPAAGFRVELSRLDEASSPGNPGAGTAGNSAGRGGRGGGPGGAGGPGGNWLGRTMQGTVAASGRFTITNVPAGNYRLRVQSGRRGSTLHEETVRVDADAAVDVSIAVTTHSLRATLATDDTPVGELAGSAMLVPGSMPPEADPATLLRTPGAGQASARARLQNGAFLFEAVEPGEYTLVTMVRGRKTTSTPVTVQGDTALTVRAGEPAPSGSGPAPATRR